MLIAISHVSWLTGHVLPLEQLRDVFDVPLLIDGAGRHQGDAGRREPLRLLHRLRAEVAVRPGHDRSTLRRRPRAARSGDAFLLRPQEYEPEGAFTAKEGAARFDSDWLALPSLAGLVSAIDTAPEWRYEAAAELAVRCRDLLLDAGLEVVTEPGQSTIVSVVPRGDPAETVAAAYEHGVVVRELPKTGWIRASCGYWTNEEDLERLVAALR